MSMLIKKAVRYNAEPPDHGLLGWAYPAGDGASGSSVPLTTAGTIYVVKVRMPVSGSVSNLIYQLTTAGATLTSGQCFMALYKAIDKSLVAVTADQSVNWVGATGVKSVPLVGGPYNLPAGDYFVAFWFNGTTGPAPYRTNGNTGMPNVNLSVANSRYASADTGITTTAPSTLGTLTAINTSYWAALS